MMPRGHGRTSRNFENVADRRSRTLFRRSSDQNNYNLSSKESQISVLVLRNSEQRCVIFTLVALELDAYWKVATFLPALQGPGQRNHLGSGGNPEVDGLESISPPAIIFQVDLQKEQRINLLEGTCSPKSSSICSSSGTHLLGEPRNWHKRSKSVKSSSSTLPSCLVLDNSSGSLCDSLSAVSSDVLVNDAPNVDKPVKKSSRKKGKKKGKQHKQSTHKKVSIELEHRSEESICGASVVGTSVNSDPACSGECISENNLFEKAASHSLSIKDITIKKDDSETNNEYTNSSITLMSCISYNDEMDECEPLACLAQGFAGEEFSWNNTTDLNSTSSTKEFPEEILSTVDVNIKDSHSEQNIICNDKSSSISLDHYDVAPLLDSFQDGWNIGISEKCSDDVETRLSVKDEGAVSFSGGMVSDSRYYDSSFHRTAVKSCVINSVMSNNCQISCPYLPKDVVDTHSSTERSQCSSQACSSNGFHPVISGKRGRTSRKVDARSGKDNNHPVWQKVHKMDTENCIYEPKNANVVSSKVDVSSKDSDTRATLDTFVGLKQNQRGKTSRYPWSHDMVSQTSKTCSFKVASTAVDSSENVKRKPSSASKQADHYSRKGSHNGNSKIARPSKIHVQQKEGLEILPHVIHNKDLTTGLNSPCSTDSSQLVVKSIEKIDFCQSKQHQKKREHRDEATSFGNICSTICDMTSSAAYNQIGPSPTSLDSLDHARIKVHSDSSNAEYYNDMHEVMDGEGNQCSKSQTESSHVDCCKPDNSFGPVLQNWVPVGRKHTVVSNTSHIDNLTASIVDEAVPNKLDINNAEVEVSSEAEAEVSSYANYFLPSVRGCSPCLNPSNEEIYCSSSETDKLTGKLRSHPHTAGEFVGVLAAPNVQSTHEVKDQGYSGFEIDLDKIIQAVDDALKLQIAEGIHLVTGSLISDFEIFIGSASPVISQGYHSRSCKTCSPKQLTINSLCLHQIPNISLRSLWQWYEEPGCYGLQVKAGNHRKSKRLHNDCFEFSAYFVPYLSAVQLFGRSGTSNVSSNGGVMISCEVDKTSKSSSYLGSLPIFSMLLPQPRKEVDACSLESSSSTKDEFFNRSSRGTNLGDGELIFEYFEYDQPPQRRPLFEKIKELVRGEASSNSQIYGDPSKLECLNMHDLHPASWYSVAWYPIYRIPEGNFRAAFLTYHSLGHFIKQSSLSNMANDSTRIVSPVVGLQSYNAKRECWFQLRGSKSKVIQTDEASCSRPEILEERLRTLEHTASVMSTASVCKGNQRSVNKHPDYHHFFSRW